jgi:hypothetical protein
MTHPCQTCKHFQPKPFFSLRKNRGKKFPDSVPTQRCIYHPEEKHDRDNKGIMGKSIG